MKTILTLPLLCLVATAFGQQSQQFYFDAEMKPVSKKEAVIYGTGETDSGIYKLTCHYINRKHPLACVEYFADSTQKVQVGGFQYYFDNGVTAAKGHYGNGKKVGLWTIYYQDGKISDSIEYNNGRTVTAKGFYYLTDNHQILETVDDVSNNQFSVTIYDNHGAVLSQESMAQDYNGLYLNTDKGCSFPGGPQAWMHFISAAIISHMDELTSSDYGTVLLRFVIDSSGNISDVRPLNKKYSTLTKMAFNAIDGGPKWVPAERDGKKVKTIRIQPVTVQVPEVGH